MMRIKSTALSAKLRSVCSRLVSLLLASRISTTSRRIVESPADTMASASGPPPAAGATASASLTRLRELAGLFLRLGLTAFGGPAAHIALMEDEVVRRRHWLTQAEFLDLIGITNLIPGPNSTEMAIHIGRQRAGIRGLLVAGVAFILPAAAI